MVIEELQLNKYRNIEERTIQFNPHINYIIGSNSQGKTNLIESIYFVTNLRSFRTSNLNTLTLKEKNGFQIVARLKKQSVSHDVKIIIQDQKKKYSLITNQFLLNQST